MEPVSEMTKQAIMSSSLETWLFDNIRGFAEASFYPDQGGRVIAVEGKIALDDLAEYVLRRVRIIEDATV